MSEVTHSTEQYPYVDQTDETPTDGITAAGTSKIEEASQGLLNPAYYPAANKPEAALNEAERAGSEFPTAPEGDEPVEVKDEDPEDEPVEPEDDSEPVAPEEVPEQPVEEPVVPPEAPAEGDDDEDEPPAF